MWTNSVCNIILNVNFKLAVTYFYHKSCYIVHRKANSTFMFFFSRKLLRVCFYYSSYVWKKAPVCREIFANSTQDAKLIHQLLSLPESPLGSALNFLKN